MTMKMRKEQNKPKPTVGRHRQGNMKQRSGAWHGMETSRDTNLDMT